MSVVESVVARFRDRIKRDNLRELQQMEADVALHGVAYYKVLEDGRIHRVDPETVRGVDPQCFDECLDER